MFELLGMRQKRCWTAFFVVASVSMFSVDFAYAAVCNETTELKDEKLKKDGGAYLDDQQLFNACWALADSVKLKPNCNETLSLTDKCETKGKARIGELKNKITVTGTCKLEDAQNAFYGKEPTFKEVRNALDAVVEGLRKTEPSGTLYSYSSFGPGGGADAASATKDQKNNREEAFNQLEEVLKKFDKNVTKYSTLISADCRNCTILQNYAVLQGAVNLVAHTYTLGTEGHKVGRSNQRLALENTDDDKGESLDNTSTKKRLAYAAPSAVSLPLKDLKVDWIAGLDADYIEEMKDIICELALDTGSGAYYQSKAYFPHAAKMQRHINKLFDVTREKYTDENGNENARLTGVRLNADNASAGSTEKIKTLYDKAGPRGTDKKQCGREPKIELKAFNPKDPKSHETKEPQWCESRKKKT